MFLHFLIWIVTHTRTQTRADTRTHTHAPALARTHTHSHRRSATPDRGGSSHATTLNNSPMIGGSSRVMRETPPEPMTSKIQGSMDGCTQSLGVGSGSASLVGIGGMASPRGMSQNHQVAQPGLYTCRKMTKQENRDVDTDVDTDTDTDTDRDTDADTDTKIDTGTGTDTCTDICTDSKTYQSRKIHFCIFAYIHATFMHTQTNYACSRAPTHRYIHTETRTHTYVHTFIHTYIHTYINTNMHTCIHEYMHIRTHNVTNG